MISVPVLRKREGRVICYLSAVILAILAVLSLVLMFPHEALELVGKPILRPGG